MGLGLMVLLTLWASSSGAGEPHLMIYDRSFSQVRDQVALVPATGFNPSGMVQLAREFLPGLQRFRLGQAYFFSSEGEANQYRSGKFVSEVAYEWWRRLYESELKRRQPLAWVFAFNAAAVLLLRDDNGRVHRYELQGQDPTIFWLGGERWEILYVAVSDVAESLRREEGDVQLEFFLRTSAHLPSDLCRAAAQALYQRTKVRAVSVCFRNDSWFITQPFFPPAYAFEPLQPPISEAEYRRRPEVYCTAVRGEMRCSTTPAPGKGRAAH